MKRSGDLCKIDNLGRIVIPVRLRRKFDLIRLKFSRKEAALFFRDIYRHVCFAVRKTA